MKTHFNLFFRKQFIYRRFNKKMFGTLKNSYNFAAFSRNDLFLGMYESMYLS
ncbi:hypothetical protein SAMN05444375_106119 [Segatella baroniae B14]|jgi:hypothetical protein|nr:hypothetical protein SAMN05444375_106119 [Segatella baroniae B14]